MLLQFAALILAGFFTALDLRQAQVVPDPIVAPSPLRMRFAGDCLFAESYAPPGGDPAASFAGTGLFSSADISMVNLEGPITSRGIARQKPYTFRMGPIAIDALKAADVDIVNLANNHVSDYGPDGIDDTIESLDAAGIRHVGAGKNAAEACRPVIMRRAGHTVAFLGFYSGVEAIFAGTGTPGVALRDLSRITRTIEALRDTGHVDYIVVNLHWGDENALQPEQQQRDFAHALIDAGANAIIGHHPHVWQPVERYHDAIIAYSLGNFLFGGNRKDTFVTGVLEITLGDGVSWRYLPVHVRHWCVEGPEDVPATPDLAWCRPLFWSR